MRVFGRGGPRAGAVTASVMASLLVIPLGAHAADASGGAYPNSAPAVGGYWAASYEPGTPRPAGFPAEGRTRNLRGETARVNDGVRSVSSNHANDDSAEERIAGLADRDSSTKWYASGSGRPTPAAPVHAIYTLDAATTVTGYSLTSADDRPARDPRAWTVLGSNSPTAAAHADDPSWTALDTESGQSFDTRHQTDFYAVGAPRAYRYYQLRVTANCAESCGGSADDFAKFQLADWTLRGTAADRSDTSALGVSVENAGAVGAADGTDALRYAGRVPKSGPASSTAVLRSGLDLPLGRDAVLSYAIRPQDTASAYAAVDLLYTDADGRHPRTLSARPSLRDTAGRAIGARAHGKTLTPGAWTTVAVDLGALAGKRVSKVLLGYDHPAARAGATLSGWVDDLRIGRAAVDSSATWTYLDAPGVDPAAGADDRTAWTRPGFDTGAAPWKRGTGPFGAKGDGTDLGDAFPVTTPLKLRKEGSSGDDIEAYFFRTTFTLDGKAIRAAAGLAGTLTYDDTATVYLNGHRVAGRRDGQVTGNLRYATPDGATGIGDPETSAFAVPASALRAGTNTLAVEIHQANRTSSDIYFGLPTLALTPAPLPFTDDQLDTTYRSDVLPTAPDGGDYFTWLLRAFDAARATPSIMGPNEVMPKGTTYEQLTALDDRTVVDINNAYGGKADPQVRKALVDGHDSPYKTMADGLGKALGPLYADALKNGELPRTKALLSNRVEKTPSSSADWYQTAKNNYRYKRPFVRMGFTGDDGLIKQWDSTGEYGGLAGDGSFPSGHTSHGYAQGVVLATLLPELAPQILARASEYGNNRIVLAFHYPTDIMGGRIVGEKTAQLRWSDPGFRPLLQQAGDELRAVLTQKCRESGAGTTLARCIAHDTPYASTGQALRVFNDRLTYGFPETGTENLPPAVPEGAENLLLTAFPELTAAQRRTVLAATEIPSGHVLDEQDGNGSWQRIDLAAAMTAHVTAGAGGRLTVNGTVVDANGVPVAGG